jgi:hypothetical protein
MEVIKGSSWCKEIWMSCVSVMGKVYPLDATQVDAGIFSNMSKVYGFFSQSFRDTFDH